MRIAPSVLAALWLSACVGPRERHAAAPPSDPLGAPDRLLLVTVANPATLVPTVAASGLHGYDALAAYGAGDLAHTRERRIAARHGLEAVAGWPIGPLKVHCVVYSIPDGRSRETVLAALNRDPLVALAQPMQTFATRSGPGPPVYNDPYVGLQRGFAVIDAARAQQWSRGEGVRVAVIDTGIDLRHPDLAGRIEAHRNFVDQDADQFAADRHGTEVAGVIGADADNHEGIVGVAPGVRILALKACWQLDPRADAANCNSFTLAKALAAAIEFGANAINLSLGGPPDPLLSQLVMLAMSRGIVVIGAIGRDGDPGGFPAGIPGVLGVASAESAARAGPLRAPGREVLTLTPGGHYDFISGSSLATAHVTGSVALLLAVRPHLAAANIRALLTSTSADPAQGGSINVCAALAQLRAAGACPATAAPH